jgi:DNA-directed RNA polymerase specialized sigma24 family protein
MYSMSESQCPVFKIGDWNSYRVDDNLFANLRRVSKTLLEPFEMQLNDRTIKEIAHDLDLNENTVKTRIKRCKEALRENL